MALKNSAKSHLLLKVPITSSEDTVREARRKVIKGIKNYVSINYVYVLTKNNTLAGVISLKEILTAPESSLVGQIATKKVTVSHPKVSIQRIAHLAIKHRIKAIPIVDEENHFLGVVSADIILEALYKEQRRHIYKSVGIVTPADFIEDTISENVVKAFTHRIPWIVIGLIGGIAAAKIVGV